eukprot:6072393-Amphidinium_carterae.1
MARGTACPEVKPCRKVGSNKELQRCGASAAELGGACRACGYEVVVIRCHCDGGGCLCIVFATLWKRTTQQGFAHSIFRCASRDQISSSFWKNDSKVVELLGDTFALCTLPTVCLREAPKLESHMSSCRKFEAVRFVELSAWLSREGEPPETSNYT